MRINKLIVTTFILSGMFISQGECGSALGAPVPTTATAFDTSQTKADAPGALSQEPRYISVHLQPSFPRLVAGESGRLQIEIRLKESDQVQGHALTWDRDAPPPVVWISTPTGSGISFLNETTPNKPGQQVLVHFTSADPGKSGALIAEVPYCVNGRTQAGKHIIWFDVSAPLVTAGGTKIQDLGVVSLPFEVDTHLRTKLLMLLIVAITVFLFIVEWVRVDVVAILMMVLLPELGLLDAQYTFRGLSSNAVMAIIGVMIISYGLNRVGLVCRMIEPLLGFVGKSTTRLAVVFSSLIAVISSVMQNTGAAVLFLPAIRLVASDKLRIPISRVLMPIGMAAILGGTLTMVGTSPLILLNDLLPTGMPKFGFLELTPIGLGLVCGGILYLIIIGLPALTRLPVSRMDFKKGSNGLTMKRVADSYPEIGRLFEIAVPQGYRPGKGPQEIINIRRNFQVNIVAIVDEKRILRIAPPTGEFIRGGSILCAYGPEAATRDFIEDYRLALREPPKIFQSTLFNPALAGIVEVVVSPRSTLIGQTIKEIRFRETYQVSPLALHQNGKTYYREMADKELQAGDALLLHGTWKQFHSLQDRHQNFIIISSCESEFHRPERAWRALICFLGALLLMVISSFYFQSRLYNPIPLSVCLMAGAIAMVLTKVMTITEAYRAVDWRTVFLLGGLIPLGMAVERTGTAQWIAKGIVAGLGDFMSPLVLLCVLAILSCGFTLVISNVGACTLLVPLGISLAQQIGIDPRVAAIVVGIGVSNSFILPTHQVNALYMGPGGYRTKDYLKIGGGLSLLYIVILVVITYFLYL